MTIYQSERVMPYVYMGVHKQTGELYYGFRKANKHPSSEDLGTHYRTSSSKIKDRFDDFTWSVIAEFFDPVEAYWHEQYLIEQQWGDPLLLNRHRVCRVNAKSHFWNDGSPEISQKISAANKGRKHSAEWKQQQSQRSKGRPGHAISEWWRTELQQKAMSGELGMQAPEAKQRAITNRTGIKRGPYKKHSAEANRAKSERQLGTKRKPKLPLDAG